ncbi:MAG: hypothetical protein D6759_01205, partial [Chloroflexi bacterium]
MPVLLFVPSGTLLSASSRYRVYQYLEPLRRRGFRSKLLRYPDTPSPIRRLAYFARLACIAPLVDVVVVQKRLFPRFLPILRRLNPRIVYDFDDALFARSSAARQAGMKRRPSDGSAHNAQSLDLMLRLARHVVAGNEYLAAYA